MAAPSLDIFWLTEYRRQFTWKAPVLPRTVAVGTDTSEQRPNVVDRSVDAFAPDNIAIRSPPIITQDEAIQVSPTAVVQSSAPISGHQQSPGDESQQKQDHAGAIFEERSRPAGIKSTDAHRLTEKRHQFLSYGWANANAQCPQLDLKTFNITAPRDQVYPHTFERRERAASAKQSERIDLSKVTRQHNAKHGPQSEYRTKFVDWYNSNQLPVRATSHRNHRPLAHNGPAEKSAAKRSQARYDWIDRVIQRRNEQQ